MLSAHSAGLLACAVSIGSLALTMLYLPALVMKINGINDQLRVDSEEFRVMADVTWGELVKQRGSGRQRRQTYDGEQPKKTYALHTAYAKEDQFVEAHSQPTCNCNAHNSCPPGPPGAPGKPGLDGEAGSNGAPGSPGLAGIAPPVTIDPNQGCRVCPHGPRGLPGSPGEPGPAGQMGGPGNPGRPGETGREGYPGNPGIPGEPGKSGKVGEQGPPGRDGTRGEKGPQGPKGEVGPAGQKGPEGYPGQDGQRGQDGEMGAAGPMGMPGQQGEPGHPGLIGTPGLPGPDGQYCKCPERSAGVARPAPATQPYVAASAPPAYSPEPQQPSYSVDEAVEAPRNPYRKWKWL